MKISKVQATAIILSALLISASLSSCSSSPKDVSQQSSQNASQESAVGDIASYAVQIEYYEGLIKELEASILSTKEESFIKSSAYQEEIDSLKNKIKLLELANNTQVTPEIDDNKAQLGTREDTDTSESQFVYEIKNGSAIITAFKGNATQVTIPQKINGLTVSAIGEDAFKGTSVRKITVSEGISYIDWFAFSDCRELSEIYIPASVTEIRHGAFDNCPSSLKIICPKGSYAERYATSWGIATEAR